MLPFKNIQENKGFFYFCTLTFLSFFINQYYGYKGILPIDSFLIFNSGYDFLNGHYPFKDYWTIKEPFIDFLQAIFFKIFGVSWFAYVLHASFFNFLITASTYYILRLFKLSIEISFFYSLCVAILTYPTAGTPFSDHHTLILCIISIYLFIISLKKNNNLLWIFIPFLLGLSFLSKQAPTAYVILMISILSIIYTLYKKKYIIFYYSVISSVFFLIIFFLLLFLSNIKFEDFFTQYILFPKSLGSTRLDWVFPLEFQRIVLRFKIHYISIAFLILILFKEILRKKKIIKIEDVLILISLIFSCFIFIFHQLMTINAIFIYCLIPIFCAFSQIYSNIYYKLKYINHFLIVLTLFSTFYYFINYVNNRTFMDLKNVDFNNAVDGNKIDKKLKGIKWITIFYPDKPDEEIKNVNYAIEILKKDKVNKMIITDYQFISVFLGEYDQSVTRFWYDFHGYPSKENKYFPYWKNFVIEKISKNNIKSIYVLKPLHGEENPLKNIFDNCFSKKNYSKVFYKIDLKNCIIK
jgi:hypothetical protein